jgi:uncharacterized membrane protein
MNRSLAVAAGLGAVSGLRTMQALAWVSRDLSSRRVRRGASGLERALARRDVALVLRGLASGELAVDKLPGIPARIEVPPLLGRALAGGVVGSVAAGPHREALGGAVGAGAAVVGAFTGWFLRREFGRVTHMPDLAVALLEDALAVAAARALTTR